MSWTTQLSKQPLTPSSFWNPQAICSPLPCPLGVLLQAKFLEVAFLGYKDSLDLAHQRQLCILSGITGDQRKLSGITGLSLFLLQVVPFFSLVPIDFSIDFAK
jgi:hypothetical protein